jgi:REP element-mobilizing transposase RayT
MELIPNEYHHIYSRSNNNEIVFREDENYRHFLRGYWHYFKGDLDTIGYCLMPTHFHFLIYVKSQDVDSIKKRFGILLSSYTKAVNKRYQRHGNLFQSHTKSRRIDSDSYLTTILTYIHQNPLRSGLVVTLGDWEHSSYRDYIGGQTKSLVKKHHVMRLFSSLRDFREFSERMIPAVEKKYWV